MRNGSYKRSEWFIRSAPFLFGKIFGDALAPHL